MCNQYRLGSHLLYISKLSENNKCISDLIQILFEKDSARMNKASATKAVSVCSDSISGRVKLKTIEIGILSFPASRSAI